MELGLGRGLEGGWEIYGLSGHRVAGGMSIGLVSSWFYIQAIQAK